MLLTDFTSRYWRYLFDTTDPPTKLTQNNIQTASRIHFCTFFFFNISVTLVVFIVGNFCKSSLNFIICMSDIYENCDCKNCVIYENCVSSRFELRDPRESSCAMDTRVARVNILAGTSIFESRVFVDLMIWGREVRFKWTVFLV